MTTLAHIQDHFQNYLLHNNEAFASDVVNDDVVGNVQRMRVYFEAYRMRLYGVLAEDSPKVKHLMGEADFQKAFIAYLNTYPSTHFSVRYFGQYFAKFLAKSHFNNAAFLAEMAKFEWLVGETLDAKDALIVQSDFLQHLTPEQWGDLTLNLHPSVCFNTFNYPTAKTWLSIENNTALPDANALEYPEIWLFWRHGLQALFISCTEAQAIVFAGLAEQKCFAEICEMCLPYVDEAHIPALVAQTLNDWIGQGMICKANS